MFNFSFIMEMDSAFIQPLSHIFFVANYLSTETDNDERKMFTWNSIGLIKKKEEMKWTRKQIFNVKSTFMLFHVSFFNSQSYLNLFVFRHTFSITRVYWRKRKRERKREEKGYIRQRSIRNEIKRFCNKEMYNRYESSLISAQFLHERKIEIDFEPKINYYSTFKRNFKSTITSAFVPR